MININFFKRLETAKLPIYSTKGAAGADVYSADNYVIKPNHTVLIDTGLDCRLPEGYELQVRSRSGLALKHNVIVLNSPGTIDPDYTGPLKVMLFNGGDTDFVVAEGDRIAQIVLAPVFTAVFAFTDENKETDRGSGGFGSTGV